MELSAVIPTTPSRAREFLDGDHDAISRIFGEVLEGAQQEEPKSSTFTPPPNTRCDPDLVSK